MESDIRSRIKTVLETKKYSINALAKEFGENQSKLTKQINSSTALACNTILLVLNKYPDVSAEWLLRGTGDMLLSPEQEQQSTAEPLPDASTTELRNTIRRQQREIDGLYERISELKCNISQKHKK